MSSQQQQQQQSQENNEDDVVEVEQQLDLQLQEDLEASVTAAEPIDDEEDYLLLDDTAIPTIRLSSLGTELLEDELETVQAEYDDSSRRGNDIINSIKENGSGSSADEEMGNANRSACHEQQLQKVAATPKLVAEDCSASGLSPEEILVGQRQLLVPKEQPSARQRLVSEDGIITEFDINGGSISLRSAAAGGGSGDGDAENDVSDDDVHIVAEAIELDASFRSVNDLELGDEDPLPYPGRPLSFSSLRARALGRSNATGASGGGRSGGGSNERATGAMRSATGQFARPELISATVIKNSPHEQIGISLLRDDTVVYSISHEEDSLLKDCPFQAGDKVLSINNKRTEHMDSAEAARMLREVTGFITIVVHNITGDPCLIETMITKANKNQRSGMGLKSTGDRDLRVSSINENGLFAQSLLNVGDRILSINNADVTEVDARVACDIIKNAPNHVTVVARSRHTHGVVVAEVSNRGLSTNNASAENVLASVPEATALRTNEITAVDDTCSMSKQQREQLIIGVCIGLIIAGVMIGYFGRGR